MLNLYRVQLAHRERDKSTPLSARRVSRASLPLASSPLRRVSRFASYSSLASTPGEEEEEEAEEEEEERRERNLRKKKTTTKSI